LRVEALPNNYPVYDLNLALELRGNELRAWWPAPALLAPVSIRFPGYRGLRDGAAAVLELNLPKGSKLRVVEILPRAVPELR
jgi:hypothetical protein